MKDLDLVKENEKYLMKYNHNGHKITSEVNTKKVLIDGKEHNLKKPFKNITAFYKFCVSTKLYKD